MKINKKEITDFRMSLGKYLHDYYKRFGEEKYDAFLDKLGLSMVKNYGDAFSCDNLRIMEAEYVTLNARLNDKKRDKIHNKQQ